MKVAKLCFVIIVFSFFGCSPGTWVYTPENPSVSTSYIDASFKPADYSLDQYTVSRTYKGFQISITNKTDKNLELVWDKTLYIYQGSTSGGFLFDGVVYTERNNSKPNDIIFANSTFSKLIWPNKYAKFFPGYKGSGAGWDNMSLPKGSHGIYLTYLVDGQEMHEKIDINLSKSR